MLLDRRMGVLQTSVLLLMGGFIAAGCGYTAAVVRRRNKRRSRAYFVLGFCCGSVATIFLRPPLLVDACGKYAVGLGAVLRQRRSHVHVLSAIGRILAR
jgi:hypothetical protein